jgi:hypothetical protein
MPFFPSLPDDAGIGDLYDLHPDTLRPMRELGAKSCVGIHR